MAVLSGGWPLLFFAPRLRAEIAEVDAHKAPRPNETRLATNEGCPATNRQRDERAENGRRTDGSRLFRR